METTVLRTLRSAATREGRRRRGFLSVPLALLIGALVALIAPQACAACSCLPLTFAQAAEQGEVIFVGTVTGQESSTRDGFGPGIDVTFEVSDVYKGSLPANALVRTADNSAACGFNFVDGQSYLVMAGSAEGGLETNLCTGTRLIGEVDSADLTSLGAPAPGEGDPEVVPISEVDPALGAGAGGADQSGSLGRGVWVGFGILGVLTLAMLGFIWRPVRDHGTA